VQVVYAKLGIALDDGEEQALLGHVRDFVTEHKHSPEMLDLLDFLASVRSKLHV
jgi:hypothetical protein